MGYSSGRKSSSLKIPPVKPNEQATDRGIVSGGTGGNASSCACFEASRALQRGMGGERGDRTFEGRTIRTRNQHIKVSKVVVVRNGRDAGGRVGNQSLSFL